MGSSVELAPPLADRDLAMPDIGQSEIAAHLDRDRMFAELWWLNYCCCQAECVEIANRTSPLKRETRLHPAYGSEQEVVKTIAA